MRAVAPALVLVLLAGCSGDGADDDAGDRPAAPRAVATAGDDDLAEHTPADLKHPCEAVTAAVAGRVLGGPVTVRRARHPANTRSVRCAYRPPGSDEPPLAEIRSAPDLTSLSRRVGLYVGADRLLHHPVDLVGADGAEVVLDLRAGVVTLFAKQGFVTHVVVVRSRERTAGETTAVRLADLVIQANR